MAGAPPYGHGPPYAPGGYMLAPAADAHAAAALVLDGSAGDNR